MLAFISVIIHVLVVDLPRQWDETYVELLVTASKLKTQIAYAKEEEPSQVDILERKMLGYFKLLSVHLTLNERQMRNVLVIHTFSLCTDRPHYYAQCSHVLLGVARKWCATGLDASVSSKGGHITWGVKAYVSSGSKTLS